MTALKISIVTPAFNCQDYIGETIDSVLSQKGDFEIEYIVVDGGSSDRTCAVIEGYRVRLEQEGYPLNCNKVELTLISESDLGMYDALNKGFRRATGEIHAWINADDIYLPGAFATMAAVFKEFPGIQWAKGITSYISRTSFIYRVGVCNLYAQDWIRQGVYGRSAFFIHQESVFWRSSLWAKVGGFDANLKLAGDYYLWCRFAEIASLVSVTALLSSFRIAPGQLSENMDAYRTEEHQIATPNPVLDGRIRRFYRHLTAQSSLTRRIPVRLRLWIYGLLYGRHQFAAVLVSRSGELEYTEGDYFAVSARIRDISLG